MMKESPLLQGNIFLFDESADAFSYGGKYCIFDANSKPIGIVEQPLTASDKALRFAVQNHWEKKLPLLLEMRDSEGALILTISRGWAANARTTPLVFFDADGQPLGEIAGLDNYSRRLELFDAQQKFIAAFSGNWSGWEYSITDYAGEEFGKVSKKWAGLFRELFTTADKYAMQLDEKKTLSLEHKALMLAAVVALDILYAERAGRTRIG